MRDDELLGSLERALVPDRFTGEPTAAEVRTLLAEVATATAAGPAVTPRSGRRWLPRVLAGGLAAVVVGGGTAYAAGDGNWIPAPVRRAAVAIRLPVDSPEVADLRHGLADLEEAIERRDTERIQRALADLNAAFGDLNDAERAEWARRVSDLVGVATATLESIEPAGVEAAPGDVDGRRDTSVSGSSDDDVDHDVGADDGVENDDDESDDEVEDEGDEGSDDDPAPSSFDGDGDEHDDESDSESSDSDDGGGDDDIESIDDGDSEEDSHSAASVSDSDDGAVSGAYAGSEIIDVERDLRDESDEESEDGSASEDDDD